MATGELGTCVDRGSQRTAALGSRDGVARGNQTLHLSALVSAFTEPVSNFQNGPPYYFSAWPRPALSPRLDRRLARPWCNLWRYWFVQAPPTILFVVAWSVGR